MTKAILFFGMITILIGSCNQKDDQTQSVSSKDPAATAASPDGDSVTITHKLSRKTYDEIMKRKKAFLDDVNCKLTDQQIKDAKTAYIDWVKADATGKRIFTHLSLDMETLINSVGQDYAALKFEPIYLDGEPTVLLEGYDKNGLMVICKPIQCLFNDPDEITRTGVFCPPPAGCPPPYVPPGAKTPPSKQ